MKPELFTEAMSQIDEHYYEEAFQYRAKKKPYRWKKWSVAAACALIVFSGTAVLAQNSAFTDRLSNMIAKWTGHTQESSEWENYTMLLDEDIRLKHGRLHLEAICYDTTYALIPFCYYPDEEIPKPGEKLSYAQQYRIRNQINIRFRLQNEEERWMNRSMSMDPNVAGDGCLEGYFVVTEDNAFTPIMQNDVIECTRGDADGRPEVLHEIRLEKEIGMLRFDRSDLAFLPDGTNVTMTLTSLSFCVIGSYSDQGWEEVSMAELSSLFDDIEILLKDNRVVHGRLSSFSQHVMPEKGGFRYNIILDEIIDLEEVVEIRMNDSSEVIRP